MATLSAAVPAFRPSISTASRRSSLSIPHLASGRSGSSPAVRLSSGHVSGPTRLSSFQVQASSSEEQPISTLDVGELYSDIKEKWDRVENKSTVVTFGGGAIVAVWFSSVIVGAINSVPLLPSVMELVGIGYSGWFVYRYLLYESGRKDLATDFDDLKKTISSAIEL